MAAIQPEIGREAGAGAAETPLRARVGETLRAERERRGWSVDDVAKHLKIRRVQLQAIEGGDFANLPRGAYAPGFVRSYAELLDLDAAELSRRFKEEAAGIDAPVELTFPTPINDSRLPGRVLVALSLLLAVGAYGTWYYVTAADRAPVPRVTAVPETLAARVPPPSATEAQARPSAPQAPAPASAAAPAPAAPPPVVAAPQPAPQIAAVPPPATPVPAPAVAVPPVAPAPSVTAVPAVPPAASPAVPTVDPAAPRAFGEAAEGRIVIRATGDSWTQVRDASGAIVFSRILRAGESYNVPNRPGLVLSTGNAGALEFRVDGQAAPAIGRPGMVERGIALDPERLAAGTARSEAPPPAAARAPGSQG